MEAVLRYVEERAGCLQAHPLFAFAGSDEVPLEARLMFLPALATFTMGFRDLNKFVLRYPHPRNAFERGIDSHTFEDQTHSQLFLEDWRALGLDRRLGWRASDTLWWLFLAADNEVPRAQGAYLRALAVADGADPLLRFAHSEVIEACGAVFFGHFSKVAAELTGRTGVEYRYLGPYHLARETGHMACEQVFAAQRLDDRRRERAIQLADAMFGLFEEFFNHVLRYARKYAAAGKTPRPLRSADLSRNGAAACGEPAVTSPRQRTPVVHPSQAPLQRLLAERRQQTAQHAFYLWLRDNGDLAPLQTLRRFIATWAIEIMGYRDLVWYALRYADPADELQEAVNRRVTDLQTHSRLFIEDWRQLDLDGLLGWTASDTLEFFFLDPAMDPHRRNFIKFTELAAAHTDPVLRLWFIEALEETGEDFFAHTSVLARAAEAAHGLRLDYLAGRHHVAHARPRPAQRAAFKDHALDPAACGTVAGLIGTAFGVMEDHLTISLEAAVSDRFAITPREVTEGVPWTATAAQAR